MRATEISSAAAEKEKDDKKNCELDKRDVMVDIFAFNSSAERREMLKFKQNRS